jgi:hypothetical protein
VTDQPPADDTPEAEDAALANAITHGLATEPATKQQVLEALHAPISEPSRRQHRDPSVSTPT